MFKILENNKLNYVVLSIIFLILIFFINTSLSFNEDSIKHWSKYHKDDIVFVYNSLLFLEGLEQHHTDHPSLYTFIIFPIFYKIAFYLGYIDFNNLTGFLNSDDINISLSKLFYISRLVIQMISICIIIIIYKISSHFSYRKSDSFFISLLFIFSTGLISASNRIESGIISIFFLLLAFLFFIKFLKHKNKKNIFYFIIVLIFIFSSLLQKKLVYFPLPFLFLSSVIFLSKNQFHYYRYKILNFKYGYNCSLFVLYIFVFSYFYLKTVDNNTTDVSRDLDFIFLLFNFILINLILFFYIKFYQNQIYENLLTYNLVFILTYFCYKYFLVSFFSANPEIWTISFTNYFGHLNMFSHNSEIRDANSFSDISLYFYQFINNIFFIIKKYFLSITYQSILVWSSILLIISFFNKISFRNKIAVFFLFSGFFVVQSIILFRYEQDTYYLNSEFLLIFLISLLLINIKKKIYYSFFISLLIIFSISTNLVKINNLKKENLKSYCYLFKDFDSVDGFYQFYTAKIPINIRKNFCKDLLI
jgi:hypothetical protein